MPPFKPPVRVALGRAGSVTHAVTGPERAAEILLNEWPAYPGSKHPVARKAVLKALEAARDPYAGAADVDREGRLQAAQADTRKETLSYGIRSVFATRVDLVIVHRTIR